MSVRWFLWKPTFGYQSTSVSFGLTMHSKYHILCDSIVRFILVYLCILQVEKFADQKLFGASEKETIAEAAFKILAWCQSYMRKQTVSAFICFVITICFLLHVLHVCVYLHV